MRIEREVRKLYAVGATVLYSTFNYSCKCRVIEQGYGTRITLRNIATGKTRSVDGTSQDVVLLEKSGAGRIGGEERVKREWTKREIAQLVDLTLGDGVGPHRIAEIVRRATTTIRAQCRSSWG